MLRHMTAIILFLNENCIPKTVLMLVIWQRTISAMTWQIFEMHVVYVGNGCNVTLGIPHVGERESNDADNRTCNLKEVP